MKWNNWTLVLVGILFLPIAASATLLPDPVLVTNQSGVIAPTLDPALRSKLDANQEAYAAALVKHPIANAWQKAAVWDTIKCLPRLVIDSPTLGLISLTLFLLLTFLLGCMAGDYLHQRDTRRSVHSGW